MTTAAIILCGGESRRMGQPKAWLPFGDERMLQRVVRLVNLAASPIVVVSAQGQELPALIGDARVVYDAVAGRGPLEGLAAGLSALPDSVEYAYATATDVPFLEPRWIQRLVEYREGHDAVVPFVEGRLHPLAALYHRARVLPVIESMLRADRRRLIDLVESIATLVLGEPELRYVDPALQTLRNLNSPEDYARALHDAGFAMESP
jgi:molybdopterin-guanine dinucleotide biosynthesis protein A